MVPAIPSTYSNITFTASAFCGATASVSLSGAALTALPRLSVRSETGIEQTCAGNRNGSSSGFLGSVAVSLVNLGSVAITPPYTVSLLSDNYVGISQSYGLDQTSTTAEGVSGVAQDTWNILWPQSTNQVTLGFVVVASDTTFAPTAVRAPALESGALQTGVALGPV